ncbi:uncharacterized protein LOC110702807 [Chenopodium quinoa]|uniref:uncharacterized protein LOC110702807 n=1 Tax=Chenopodium quinoa TaxID=63459 RepID=UPI000B76C164|nr:uncharacterized protein LOC110702807 [Chenopodium quinoa]
MPKKNAFFYGKLGIFPFTYEAPALRSSKYRNKGEMVTKVVERITRDVSRKMLIENIVPAIMEKWPNTRQHNTIYIQQDNAKPHVLHDDPEWQLHCKQPGFSFILIQQPPNSPDLNILDLGFFRSIQSLQHKKFARNPEQLIKVVKEAFYELHAKTLFKCWVTLNNVMNQILKAKGSNKYEPPHVNKAKLDREGRLQDPIEAPLWAVIDAWERVHGDRDFSDDEQEQENIQTTQNNASQP